MMPLAQWEATKARLAATLRDKSIVTCGLRYPSDVAELITEVEQLRRLVLSQGGPPCAAPSNAATEHRAAIGGDRSIAHIVGDSLGVGERSE